MKDLEENPYTGACIEALERSSTLSDFWATLDSGKNASLGVVSIVRPFLVASYFQRNPQTTLCIVASEDQARVFSQSLKRIVGEDKVFHFPELPLCEKTKKEDYSISISKRNEALYALFSGCGVDCSETFENSHIVVASASSLTDMLLPPLEKSFLPLTLKVGDDLSLNSEGVRSFDEFLDALQERGFINTGELEGPGSFCVHGGTVDVFPGNVHYPLRIDFFGDEIDEIHRLLTSTGQTIASLESFDLFPVVEVQRCERMLRSIKKKAEHDAQYSPEIRSLLEILETNPSSLSIDALKGYAYPHLVSLSEYIDEFTLCVFIEPLSLVDAYQFAVSKKIGDLETKTLFDKRFHSAFPLASNHLQTASYITLMQAGKGSDYLLKTTKIDANFYSDVFFEKINALVAQRFVVVCGINGEKMRQELSLMLVERHIPIVNYEEDARFPRGRVTLTTRSVPGSFVLPDPKLAFINFASAVASADLALTRRIDVTEITFPYAPGDYVVHAVHGIALFKNLTRRELDGVVRDYLELEYDAGDMLYVPVEQLDRVTRYVGPSSSKPRLTRLNTTDWSNTVKKARKSTKKLAFDLVDVYSRRAQAKGYVYLPDTESSHQLAESFPYKETPDQLRALKEIKSDMESTLPMDRLLCGDVGFGKTEVALRTAFKAVESGKQVFVLCPTTILAQQHYSTFRNRLEPFGVRVEVLSRFRTTVQKRETLEALSHGEVDVLIGTHRLLSRDINPLNLGLVIIDEEQRFGVAHKERFKNMRESLDVLALSATPIPRTLQMSLTGVRNMSLITTPPDDRLPVEVFVGEWDEELVSEAISKEIARGGQVYYVSNRVQTIEGACMRVQKAAPEARIGVVHGKLSKKQMEAVMEEFAARNIDVLVATSIIESGIDCPYTNTLIIEDSQRLGLSQMYQLKGRVGRSSTQAYAYFMFPPHMSLSEEASSRLMALFEHQDLGSGMKIAMRDLEIRGAGNILGAEQSGNVSGVGFDLFAQMLQEALIAANEEIAEGGKEKATDIVYLSDISINLDESAYFSEDLIPDIDKRIVAYRRLACASTIADVMSVKKRIEDEWGPLDEAAQNCIDKSALRAFAGKIGIHSLYISAGKVIVEPISTKQLSPERARKLRWQYLGSTKRLKIPLRGLPNTGQSLAQKILVTLEANVR